MKRKGEIIRKMKDPQNGVDRKERKWRFRKYGNCFIGSEAVTWLLNNTPLRTRKAAVSFGNALLTEDVFSHVLNEHDFEDSSLFYHFLVLILSVITKRIVPKVILKTNTRRMKKSFTSEPPLFRFLFFNVFLSY